MHGSDKLGGQWETLLAEVPPARLKVGVLTFHRCINYGSFWQARCLVAGLNALGHEAELLDHADPLVERAELRCALQPLLPERSPPADRRRHAEKIRRFLRSHSRLPLSRSFALDDPAGLGRYDAVVIGSDEVWNLSHPWYAGRPAFWGEGLSASRLIAHAASSGSHTGAFDGVWQQRLASFDTIAVRDETTRALVREATGNAPPLVLDPVLQFPPAPPVLQRAPYALVYGHEFPDWLGPAARAWAEGQGLRLLSIGYRNGFAHEQWLEANPESFAAAVQGARAIITSMFHGAVFALACNKPFAAMASPYRATKLTDLTTLLGIPERLVGSAEGLVPMLDAPLTRPLRARIAQLRAQSHATLRAALA